jgi:transcriptional/translational regulatory protein YebC/TACO1
VTIRTNKTDLKSVTEAIGNAGWQVLESEIIKVADNKLNLDEESRAKWDSFIELLEEHEDVDNVWTNIEE